MAAFDLASVAAQARTGVVPEDWALFPLVRRSALLNALGALLLALFALGLAVYLYTSGLAFVPKFLPDSAFTESGKTTTSLIESLLFVALGVWLAFVTFRWVRAYSNHQSYFIVVTPAGFAEVQGAKEVGAAFADVAAIRQKSGYFGLEFLVQKRSGRSFALEVGKNYGDPRQVFAAMQNGLVKASQ
jgi:hypothetical protein